MLGLLGLSDRFNASHTVEGGAGGRDQVEMGVGSE